MGIEEKEGPTFYQSLIETTGRLGNFDPNGTNEYRPLFFEVLVEQAARVMGKGFLCDHLHLDRAGTLDEKYLKHYSIKPLHASTLPLEVKQDLLGETHIGPAYKMADLLPRMRFFLNLLFAQGIETCTSFIDTTADLEHNGLVAIEAASELREEFKQNGHSLQIGSYGLFGYREDRKEPRSRWGVFKEASEKYANFLGILPERDDENRGSPVGFDKNVKMSLELACTLGKPLHVHVDQGNTPYEDHTLRLIDAVHWIGSPESQEKNVPMVWAVHQISPSTYGEAKFNKMVEGLLKHHIGVICCPHAGLSMRQLRHIWTPIHNSIARVPELLAAGVPVRIGCDNLADIFIPTCRFFFQEIATIADTCRFYDPEIWAKVATGTLLNNTDRARLRDHLSETQKVSLGERRKALLDALMAIRKELAGLPIEDGS